MSIGLEAVYVPQPIQTFRRSNTLAWKRTTICRPADATVATSRYPLSKFIFALLTHYLGSRDGSVGTVNRLRSRSPGNAGSIPDRYQRLSSKHTERLLGPTSFLSYGHLELLHGREALTASHTPI